ncbi:MAG: hypothetical protein J7647_04240 [Cyanobacteria bacterium SBLK]|nr:hypothetical protein [Cyanobacteria bacterium SBLK]
MSKNRKKIKKYQTSNNRFKEELEPPKNISFSFKYWQSNHEKFSVRDCETTYFFTLLERLKNFSTWTVQELLSNRSSAIRCHPIGWNDTTEDGFGLPNEEQLVDTPYQLSISTSGHGRIHGFFIGDIFYIVWLDPKHLLYS